MIKTVLKKENLLFERDDNGELVAQEVKLHIDEDIEFELAYKDETVFITPMSRGEIKRMFSNIKNVDDEKDVDAELIVKHLVNPKITKEDIPALKSQFINMLVNTILINSGMDIGNKKKSLKKKEDDFQEG